MNRGDFNDIEDKIINTVQNAIDAMDNIDLKNIKSEISNRAQNSLKNAKDTFNTYNSMMKESCKEMNIKYEGKYKDVKSRINKYNEDIQRERNKREANLKKDVNKNKSTTQQEGNNNDIYRYISSMPSGSISGVVWIFFGSLFAASTLILSLIFLFGSAMIDSLFINLSIIFMIMFGLSLAAIFNGINIRKRVSRFKSYVRIIGKEKYCLISDLAKFTKEKPDFVVKELNKMISLNMFKQGHLDDEKTYFMMSDEVYRNYLALKKQQIINEREQKNNLNKNEDNSVEMNSVVRLGREHIKEITKIRSELYNRIITEKLDKLIDISNQILSYVDKNPNKIQEINKFINHYLPITIKLVASYKELDNQVVKGDNINKAKLEVEKSIDVINEAFENLLDDLFEDVALDVSTDISVLKTLFKQEGLTEEDFEK